MNNSTSANDSSPCYVDESYKFVYLSVAYSICSFLGLTLNGFVFWCLIFKTKKWSCNSIYMANLAVTDFLYAISLIFLIHNYILHDTWVFGDFMCRLIRFLFYFNLYGSILFLTAISLYRYLGICHPISSRGWQRLKYATASCAIIWVLTFAETAPYLYFAGVTGTSEDATNCWDFVPDKARIHLPCGVMLTVLGFMVPFVVTLVFYSCIINTLWRSMKEAIIPLANARTNRRKSMYTIVVVLAIFAVCHLPYNINKMVFFLHGGNAAGCEADAVYKAYKMVRPLASLNCALNPTLFFVSFFRSQRARHTRRFVAGHNNYGSRSHSLPNAAHAPCSESNSR